MSDHAPAHTPPEGSFIGTLGWVGVVILGAILAMLLLNALGPVGQ